MREAIQWDEVLQQYKNSGLSMQLFCKENKLSYEKFKYRWYRKNGLSNTKVPRSKIDSNPNAFEVITVTDITRSTTSLDTDIALTIHLPNLIRCELKIGLNSNELPKLLQQLVSLC